MLSELALRRPVLATVASLLIIVIGFAALLRLPVRELPDVDPARISVRVDYTGAAAEVIDTEVVEVIEAAVAGVAGIDTISSTSRFGRGQTNVTFTAGRNVDEAANDIRDAVARIRNRLPAEANEPQVFKNDSDSDPVIRLSIMSERMGPAELTDFARRYVVERLSTLDGVADVQVFGQRAYAIRIWLDRRAMAARNLTVEDIEAALRQNNLELPAGEITSATRQLVIRTDSRLRRVEEFREVVVDRQAGHPIRLSDIARVELGVEDEDTVVTTNGRDGVGLGILRQSQANTIAISNLVRAEVERIRVTLPAGMEIIISSDEATFIRQSIREVVTALAIAVALVIAIIYLFLGTWRATLVPAVTIPVAIIGAFIGIWALGFSINILTLLALILAIGLVVDDSIVVLENIERRIQTGEPPLVASLLGARQVTFAVLATTATLVAVFVPISLLEGQVGRLFGEFGFVLAFAVLISTFVALSLAPPVAAAVLRSHQGGRGLVLLVDRAVDAAARGYRRLLRLLLAMPLPMIVLGGLASALVVPLYLSLPRELTPAEDRGVFFVAVTAPEGSNIAYTDAQVQRVLEVVEPLRAAGVAERIFAVSGAQGRARRGFVVVGLTDWAAREQSVQDLIAEVRPGLGEVAGAQAFPTAPAGLGLRGSRQPLQVVIGGPEFAAVEGWANQLLERLEQLPGLSDLSIGYEVNSPQLRVAIDRERANDLGISVQAISATLQTMLASREITTYVDRGREYPVIVQAAAADRRTPDDLANIFVRARSGDLVPLDALVTVTTVATSPELTRSDRLRSVGIGASLEPGMDLGRAIDAVVAIAAEILPPEARLSFGGQSKEYLDASGSLALVFALALLIVFLVLAAQFESFIHPVAIILAVPLALTGALASLWLTGNSLNVYTQIGIVLLVGLVAKNGILIIEFANQLRDEGLSVREAIIEGAAVRLRPVLMTVISTILGAVPLVLASGAGAEARSAIGIVIVGGLGVATLFNLIITPVLYDLLAGLVRPRAARSHALDAALARNSRHSPAE